MLIDIKNNPLADYINGICKNIKINPIGDVFAGCSLGKHGFSIRYNELLSMAIVHNWDPAYNKNSATILKSKKKFNQFLTNLDLLEGIAPENILSEYLRLARKFFEYELIITNFLESQRIYLTIEKIANSDSPTCIFGETGTGKELVANIIHKLSKKKSNKGKFIVLNCAGMPDHLLHREVFGYAKRAFPGATEDHDGYIAEANGGTLFLDEIGASGELFQKSMLRFLNDGSYNRLGDPQARASDCRIICTTKSPIQTFHKEIPDKVRSDFYHRITGHIVYLPPLRHVRSNIPLLILFYSLATAKKFGFTDTIVFPGILLKFWITGEQWKGNYRQLKNSVVDYVTKFIHLEREGGYKIDRPFYDLVPLSGKWFEKNPIYILKKSQADQAPYNRLFNMVDSHAILPYLKNLKIGEKVWNNTIVDLLHMITSPYLHYALFRYNGKTGKCDYDMNSYTKYTNFRFATDYEDFDESTKETRKPLKSKPSGEAPKKKIVKGKSKVKKYKAKKPTYPIEEYNRIEATIEVDDYKNEFAKKEFVLIPEHEDLPKITIDYFINTQTREFTFLLFLIYEREQGGKDWLSKILLEERKLEREKLNEVMSWCDLPVNEKDIDERWSSLDKRRFLKKKINSSADKSGLIGELIKSTGRYKENEEGQFELVKKFGGSTGSYMLNPGLQAYINRPPKQ